MEVIMFQKAACRLSETLAGRGIFAPEDAAVYAYGFELMLSTAVNIALVIVISLLFSAPLSWIFFLLAFIPLRVTAGGYHAKTHLVCCTVFSVSYAVLLLPAVFLTAFLTPVLLTGLAAANFLLVLLLAPLPASGKPLDEKTRTVNRRRSVVIAAIALAVTAASFFAGPGLLKLFCYFALGQAGAAISLVAAKMVHK
jgi:accessory gene regulator B